MAQKFPLQVMCREVELGTRSVCSKLQNVQFRRHDCRAWTWNFSVACQCRPNLWYVSSSISEVGLRIPITGLVDAGMEPVVVLTTKSTEH